MKNFLYMTESEKTEWETSSSMSVTATSGTPTIVWGGAQSQRFSDFMMKATALPSNTDIQ